MKDFLHSIKVLEEKTGKCEKYMVINITARHFCDANLYLFCPGLLSADGALLRSLPRSRGPHEF
jgi:hypothetical protein